MVSWKRLTRWCRRRLIHLHNQNKHPHPLIWARGFAPPPKKTSLLTKSSLSSWFVQHSQPRAFVLPWLSWKILLVYFFLFGHFGDSVHSAHLAIHSLQGEPGISACSPDPVEGGEKLVKFTSIGVKHGEGDHGSHFWSIF